MSMIAVNTITPLLTVVYFGALSTTMTARMVPISVDLTVSSKDDVILLPQLILRDTMKGSADLTTVPKQEQP